MPGQGPVYPRDAVVSVAEVAVFEMEPWGGYQDDRLPIGIWKGQAEVTGDVSGGLRSVSVVFAPAEMVRTLLIFSLDELYITDTKATSVEVLVQAQNLGSVSNGNDRPFTLRLNLNGGPAGTGLGTIVGDQRAGYLPAFLGGQRNPNSTTRLIAQVENSDGHVFQMWAGGYVWGSRSLSAASAGPVRPNPGHFSP